MKITLRLSVSHVDRSESVTLDELDITDKEWEQMSDSEKRSKLVEYVDSIPDQPYWCIESFE